jgi:hypothetical protein
VSFSFAEVVVGRAVRASRPLIDITLDGFDAAPQRFLIDTGAQGVRMSAEIAEALGIELNDLPIKLGVGGAMVSARAAHVTLSVDLDAGPVVWEAPVWFCDPWPHAFGLAGLRGFLDCFDINLRGADEQFDLVSRLEG